MLKLFHLALKLHPDIFLEESHSNTKILAKLGITKTKMLHMDYFKDENVCSATWFHAK